jgi:DNA-binding LacI/PurR family transcriptional regulator
VVTTINDPFFGRIVEGIENVAQAANYSTFLSMSGVDEVKEMSVVQSFYRRRVDAIIISSLSGDLTVRAELERIKIPIVLINNQTEGKYLHSVAVDDVRGGEVATHHLLDLGHRRIAFLETKNRPKSNRLRREGYEKAHREASVPLDPKLIIPPLADDDVSRGQAALRPLLDAKATAVFCYNDMTAVGLMKACRAAGVRVPQDLSIVGYDDVELTNHVTPALTTMHQPRRQLGKQAMEMTLALLDGENRVLDQVLDARLVVRESTARLG